MSTDQNHFVKILTSLAFVFTGSFLLNIPSVSAGPADTYADPCKWNYKFTNPQGWEHDRCLTERGRILDFAGTQVGVLNKDFTYYKEGVYNKYVSRSSAVITTKFQQVNRANTLIEYLCYSNANGSCIGQSSKTLFQYTGN